LHSGKPFTRASLARLLSNVLYTGAVTHEEKRYPGEHTAIVSEELWRGVQQKLQLRPRHRKRKTQNHTDALLAAILNCGRCSHPMLPAVIRRHGRLYRYYVCRRKGANGCAGVRVSAADIETSLLRHLSPVLGHGLSRPVLEQALERVTYEATTRRVAIAFGDGTQTEYVLAEATRPGNRRRRPEPIARVPRVSRLIALAIRIDTLIREGKVDSYGGLAEAGQISRPRMSQMLQLLELAPAIQERLLFLPKIVSGRDPISEHALRKISRIVDWEVQMESFRDLMACAQTG
jgi:hypothetical protein